MIIIKIDRLIGILTVLLQNEKTTAPKLAEKFEVSRRTINRDIEDLCFAGIPIYTMQGMNGGISIAEGYKMDKTLLTSDDMREIISAIKSLDSISGTNRYKQLMDKFNVDVNKSDNKIYDASGCIQIDLASHYKSSLAPKIEFIRNAIGDKKLIIFEYYCYSGETIRKIEPYLIVFEWSSWYVWGYCTDKQEFRMFKLNRLINLTLVEETFMPREIPPYKDHINSIFENNIHLKAIFQKDVKWKLIDEFGLNSFITLENGELYFEFDFTNKENLMGWVLGFGDKVRLIEPITIKQEYLNIIESIKNQYYN